MGNTGALLLHGLFEHKGRHQINADWFNNLKIDTNLIDLPGHGKDDLNRGDIESWELNDHAVIKGFESLNNYDNKILIDFQKFIKDKDPIILPGRKDLDNFALKVEKLNSSNIIVKKAIDSLNEFYFNEEAKLREKESNDILKLLHLEFAGLFDGPVGRLKQALNDDNTIQLAILMLANDSLYKDTLKPSRIAKN